MFTVVIPLYNKEHIIAKTVASVLAQSFTEFELIVVNDGSTDNSLQNIQQFVTDKRLKIISQENKGVSVARNRGIQESKYNYIAFLDGDDEWLPDFLKTIKQAIDLYPEAGLYGTSSLHKDFVTGEIDDATVKKYKGKIVIADCFKDPRLLPHTSAIVASKSALAKVDGNYIVFPEGLKSCEDLCCFNRVAIHYKLIYIGIPLAIRHNNIKGQITDLSESERDKTYINVIFYYNLLYNFSSSKKNTQNVRDYIRYQLRHNIKVVIMSNKSDIIQLILKNINSKILCYFEYYLYSNNHIKIFALFFININKIMIKIKRIIFK